MKLLLLGPNGQLGSDILGANACRSRPFEIQTLTRAALDVSSADKIADALADREFDGLINCTSFHQTDQVEGQGSQAIAVNAKAPQALARVCAARKARFVHISTDYVFGGQPHANPLTETDAPAPVNVYGASKLLGENLAFAEHDDALVLRVASLFGISGASGKGGNFVETMIRLGRERGSLRVVADQIMSPTATADVAQWIFRLLEDRAPAGLYHTVNTGQASWHELAVASLEMAGVTAQVEPIPASAFPTIAMRPPYSALDNAKLVATIGAIRGWRPALKDYLAAKGHI